jgi:hypothetical protein
VSRTTDARKGGTFLRTLLAQVAYERFALQEEKSTITSFFLYLSSSVYRTNAYSLAGLFPPITVLL